MIRWLWVLCLGCVGKEGNDTSGPDTGDPPESTEPLDTAEPPDPLDEIDPSTLPAGASPCRAPVKGRVVEVIDGDTVKVETGRGVERVRLIGIDTPEVDHSGPDDDCFGEEAKAFVTATINNKSVWLTFDQECEDAYDRTLAYLHRGTEDNDFIQRLLLQGGWATVFRVAPNVTFHETFLSDAATASASDLGLWGECS